MPDLLLATNGAFWVGTQGGAALLRWTAGAAAGAEAAASRPSKPVADQIGQPARPVESLVEDAAGQVWLGPRLRVDPRTWQAASLRSGRRLQPALLLHRQPLRAGGTAACFSARPRACWWSTRRGSRRGPSRPRWWRPRSRSTARALPGRRPPAGSLELLPGQKSFSLDFAALDFTAPERNRYRYQLEGYDSSWQEADAAHRSLTYTNLRPGDYRLQVAGSNRAGLFSPQQLELALQGRSPPSSRPRLFRLAAAALALAAAAYGMPTACGSYQLERRSRALELLVRSAPPSSSRPTTGSSRRASRIRSPGCTTAVSSTR